VLKNVGQKRLKGCKQFYVSSQRRDEIFYIIIVSCLFAQNVAGTFRCACPEGFIQHLYRNECVDDNECNQSPCGSGTCYNTYGSYRCGCPDGYQFDTALSVCIQVKSFLRMTEKIVIFKLSVLCSQKFCVYNNRKYRHFEKLGT